MQILTHAEVIAMIEKFCESFPTYSAAAERIGCSKAQIALARSGQQPPCPAILRALKLERPKLYVSGLEKKYRE